jgi:hypothetical protein
MGRESGWGLALGPRPSTLDPVSVRMLPYPGGRHPRIGFLDGAVDPQRETKVSVFTPWDPNSYVVIDVPEAIWSQHGLAYTWRTRTCPTMWTKQNVTLEPLEWKRNDSNSILTFERTLPNGVAFGARAEPLTNSVRMELWLKNGSKETLRDLRVQNCVMLKGAAGFNQQTNANKIFQPPYVAVGSPERTRWIITAWEPLHRAWANPPVPCLHSDPKFPDCAPGETQRVAAGFGSTKGLRSRTNWRGYPRCAKPPDTSTASDKGRCRSSLALGSLTICSLAPSHSMLRPTRHEIIPSSGSTDER